MLNELMTVEQFRWDFNAMDKNPDDVSELKVAVLNYLRKHPGNLAGAAKQLKISNAQILELRNRFLFEFQQIEDEHLDRMVELCTRDALGELSKDEFPDFNFNKAWKFLERRRSHVFGSSSVTKKEVEKETPSNGKAEEMLREYERKKGILRPGDWN